MPLDNAPPNERDERCGAITEQIHPVLDALLGDMENGGLQLSNSVKMAIRLVACALLVNFIGRQAHISSKHSGQDLTFWRRRMFEEARLTVTALAHTGLGWEHNDTLAAAISEVTERAIMRGEDVCMRVSPKGWYCYEMTPDDKKRHDEAMERGEAFIAFENDLDGNPTPADPVAPPQVTSLPQGAKDSDEIMFKYLSDWKPGQKTN